MLATAICLQSLMMNQLLAGRCSGLGICACSPNCVSAPMRREWLGAFTALMMRRYADDASDGEWVTLVGQLSRVADPGLAVVKLLYSAP
jgi:hypothetical protein